MPRLGRTISKAKSFVPYCSLCDFNRFFVRFNVTLVFSFVFIVYTFMGHPCCIHILIAQVVLKRKINKYVLIRRLPAEHAVGMLNATADEHRSPPEAGSPR